MDINLLIFSRSFSLSRKIITINAARGRNYTKEHYEEKLSEIDRIDKLFGECERIDKEESTQESLVKMKKELADNKAYRSRIREILKNFKEQDCYYCPEGHELERQYEQPESQDIHKRKKSRVEHPFGHIKRNLV